MLDMRGLQFLDSTGIATLIQVAKRLAETGWCLYLHLDDGLAERVLSLTRIAKAPNIHVIDHQGFRSELPA